MADMGSGSGGGGGGPGCVERKQAFIDTRDTVREDRTCTRGGAGDAPPPPIYDKFSIF